jgi:hypothetical protein
MRKENITPRVIELAKEIYEAGVRFEPYVGMWVIYENDTRLCLGKTIVKIGKDKYEARLLLFAMTTVVENKELIPIPDFLDCVRWLREKGCGVDIIDIRDEGFLLEFFKNTWNEEVGYIKMWEGSIESKSLLEAILSCVLQVARREK